MNTNYARHIKSGVLVFFTGLGFAPKNPQEWAIFHPLPMTYGSAFHRIGEDPDIYWLRNAAKSAEGYKLKRILELKQKWERVGLTPEERTEVERIAVDV